MPTLRTIVTIWIGFLVGTITAVVFLALTPPVFSQLLDGLLTILAFAAGTYVGVALARYAHSAPIETVTAAEPMHEALRAA